jgi:hypothetical protein
MERSIHCAAEPLETGGSAVRRDSSLRQITEGPKEVQREKAFRTIAGAQLAWCIHICIAMGDIHNCP